MMQVSEVYRGIAERVTGKPLPLGDDPRAEIIDALSDRYQLIE